jgi:uncharacterized spore protein YtfJ
MGTEKPANYQSPIARIFEKFTRQQDVSLVYGEPIEFKNKKVLTVAKVNYIVGGGGGYSEETGNSLVAQGEGGGGHISIRPLGVYEIDAKKVKFKPIIDFKFTLTLFALLTLGLTLLSKKTRPK